MAVEIISPERIVSRIHYPSKCLIPLRCLNWCSNGIQIILSRPQSRSDIVPEFLLAVSTMKPQSDGNIEDGSKTIGIWPLRDGKSDRLL